jgi:hypothetical protein
MQGEDGYFRLCIQVGSGKAAELRIAQPVTLLSLQLDPHRDFEHETNQSNCNCGKVATLCGSPEFEQRAVQTLIFVLLG